MNEVIEIVEDWDNDDLGLERLERAMQYYCSNAEKMEGYKYALLNSLLEQKNNHASVEDSDAIESIQRVKTLLGLDPMYCTKCGYAEKQHHYICQKCQMEMTSFIIQRK